MFPTLKSPPIIEAVVEVVVQVPSGVKVSDFEKFHDSIKLDYPKKTIISNWQGSFELKQGEPIPKVSAQNLGVRGYLFHSKDQKQVLQFRLDGFAFSRLKPYLGWGQLIEEVKKFWRIYVEITKPISISRISVRNINVIEIAGTQFDLEQYFNSSFKLAEKIEKKGIQNFLVRLDVEVENNIRALITHTVQQTSNPNVIPILFDIDILMESALPLDEEVLLKTFERLHTIKNEFFFNSVTEKTLEMFK